ncbi:MAG: hypothetical protein ROZ09_06685 [Thiobacillus sp.]|jgi:TorA maturation chaperone TorD|uniref:hypothetical protein n=1 Tax=Thiobacillus sp. TaxID=924 RepID=UPI0028956B6F|nr:hypothetical protein [Thiobacillus sp.]MDT3706498.1 hypothetical protein [Thiobacillus sp.]
MAAVNSNLPSPELFAVRLKQALDFRASRYGTLNEDERVAFTAKAAGRSTRTARSWLRGDNLPRRNRDIHALADALGACYFWLHFGIGKSPLEAFMVEHLSTWPPEYVPKFTRYLIRLGNDDPKAWRWQAMCVRRELSLWQVLDMV